MACCWATNWRTIALQVAILAGSIGLLGYTALLNRARSPLVAVSIPQLLLSLERGAAPNLWYLTCQLCYLGFGWRRQLCSTQNPGLSDCWRLDGRAKAYILKRYRWYCAHFWRLTPEVLLTTMSGHHLGSVDCWLCQSIHQIFGGDPAGYPRLRVESAWVTSS